MVRLHKALNHHTPLQLCVHKDARKCLCVRARAVSDVVKRNLRAFSKRSRRTTGIRSSKMQILWHLLCVLPRLVCAPSCCQPTRLSAPRLQIASTNSRVLPRSPGHARSRFARAQPRGARPHLPCARVCTHQHTQPPTTHNIVTPRPPTSFMRSSTSMVPEEEARRTIIGSKSLQNWRDTIRIRKDIQAQARASRHFSMRASWPENTLTSAAPHARRDSPLPCSRGQTCRHLGSQK
jgi:hypothetical protein